MLLKEVLGRQQHLYGTFDELQMHRGQIGKTCTVSSLSYGSNHVCYLTFWHWKSFSFSGKVPPEGLSCLDDWLNVAASVYGVGMRKDNNFEVSCNPDLFGKPLNFQCLQPGLELDRVGSRLCSQPINSNVLRLDFISEILKIIIVICLIFQLGLATHSTKPCLQAFCEVIDEGRGKSKCCNLWCFAGIQDATFDGDATHGLQKAIANCFKQLFVSKMSTCLNGVC